MEFVLWIIAISTIGWLANNWIRAKHGYSLEDEWGGKTHKAGADAPAELHAEVRELQGKVDIMQDRMAVLERIVTDRGYSLSQEIEALRDRSHDASDNAGMPLDFARKENA